MSRTKKNALSRREFAGTLAIALVSPALLVGTSARAQEKKPEQAKPPATTESDEERALKRLREFKVPEGAEPAFAFRADWSAGRR